MRWSASLLNRILIRFKTEQRGLMTIELAIVMMSFFAIIFFAIDMGIYFTNKSKVERVTYSITSLFRERTNLYSSRFDITKDDVQLLAQVARVQLGDEIANGALLLVEGLYFDNDDPDKSKDNAVLLKPPTQSMMVNIGSVDNVSAQQKACFSEITALPLTELKNMSVWTSQERWTTVYRVSLCAPNKANLLQSITQFVNLLSPNFVASNIMLAR